MSADLRRGHVLGLGTTEACSPTHQDSSAPLATVRRPEVVDEIPGIKEI